MFWEFLVARENDRERTNNGEEKEPINDAIIKKEPSWSEEWQRGENQQ